MREHFDNYEKKIMEKLDQEAEEIRRAIDSSPEVADIRAGESLDQKVYASIEAYEEVSAKRENSEGARVCGRAGEADTDPSYAELSEEDREALRLGRELQERRKAKESRSIARRKFGMWKRAAAVLVVLVLAGGIGVTSVGRPEKIVKFAKQVVGDRELSEIDRSSKDVKQTGNDEEANAYQQIKDELGIDPVRILLVPKKMSYKYCEIDPDIRTVQLLYEYNGKNISYLISDSHGEELWITDIEDDDADSYPYIEGKLNAEITKHELPEEEGERYTAEFEYLDVHYQLTGTMDWQEFEEILLNLHFPA